MRNNSHEFGVVILKEWMPNPVTGNQVNSISGPIKLTRIKEDWGFDPTSKESNWGVVVGNKESEVMILGCQICAVYWGKRLKPSHNTMVLE